MKRKAYNVAEEPPDRKYRTKLHLCLKKLNLDLLFVVLDPIVLFTFLFKEIKIRLVIFKNVMTIAEAITNLGRHRLYFKAVQIFFHASLYISTKVLPIQICIIYPLQTADECI